MYEKPHVNVKVEPRSTFTSTRGFSYVTSILIYAHKDMQLKLTHVKITPQWKSTYKQTDMISILTFVDPTAEVTGSNPVEALIFFRLLPSNCLDWKIYCDDHSSLSLLTSY